MKSNDSIQMSLTFLGTGTSIGVPAIGCNCEVCRSTDLRDKRLRASALLETSGGLRILIDCGPDFRQQIMPRFGKLDAVLLTHIHYDHVSGIDDLRPFSLFGDVDIYAQSDVVDTLHHTLPYCFCEHLYPGVPHLRLHTISAHDRIHISRRNPIKAVMPASGSSLEGVVNKQPAEITIPSTTDEVTIIPVSVLHGAMPILGFRIGHFAYITDMKSIRDEELAYLDGIETLVVNALRFEKPHHSHQLVDDAIAFSRRIGAKHTYFTHLTHEIGTHDNADKRLPQGFHFAYDGLRIQVR